MLEYKSVFEVVRFDWTVFMFDWRVFRFDHTSAFDVSNDEMFDRTVFMFDCKVFPRDEMFDCTVFMLDWRVFRFTYMSKFDVCKLDIIDSIVFMLTPLKKMSLPSTYVTFDKLPSVTSVVDNTPKLFAYVVKLDSIFDWTVFMLDWRVFPRDEMFD